MRIFLTPLQAGAVRALCAAALVLASSVDAKDLSANWRTDCVGYHTLKLPGNVEYPVQRPPFSRGWEPQFSDGLHTWGNNSYLDLGGRPPSDSTTVIRVTALTDADGLKAVLESKNAEQKKEKDDLLRKAALFTAEEGMGKVLLQRAADLPFYEPIPNRPASSIPSKEPGLLDLQVLIGGRIVSLTHKLEGTPQQTVDAFLRRYKPREPFEVPSGPGVCLPYATVTEEARPAAVGMSIRLLDRPDIVVYLRDVPVDTRSEAGAPQDVLDYEIARHTHGSRGFIGATPSNKLKPFHRLTLAGQPAVGAFTTIYRDNPDIRDSQERRKAKPILDWGYVAYAPGDKNAPLGTSSTLTFKVLRYGRYAQQPMTEKEFRKLAEAIAASIQRRPGAWVPN
jgi:hypothetical protein